MMIEDVKIFFDELLPGTEVDADVINMLNKKFKVGKKVIRSIMNEKLKRKIKTGGGKIRNVWIRRY